MSISFDRVAGAYDRTRGFPSSVMNEILKVLEEELNECARILDVGVGTGRFSKPLQDLGFEVIGVDISRKMLRKAYEKRTQDLMLADALNLPFSDSTFDASISVHVLHLVKDWRSVLREITRVTKRSLITILSEDPEYEVHPGEIYKKLVKEYGYTYTHPGLGEWKLKEIVKPTKSRFITSYHLSMKDSIAFLDEKTFSYQWNVPDELHKRAMEKLRKMFSGQKEYVNHVYLYKWDISGIKDYLERVQ
jgi:ubiquinone/menaquinone biosynthesis C-methylase UbiE